jgi:hypothetical protein
MPIFNVFLQNSPRSFTVITNIQCRHDLLIKQQKLFFLVIHLSSSFSFIYFFKCFIVCWYQLITCLKKDSCLKIFQAEWELIFEYFANFTLISLD